MLFLLTLLLAGSCADPKYNDFATIFSNTLRNDSTLLVNNILSIYNKVGSIPSKYLYKSSQGKVIYGSLFCLSQDEYCLPVVLDRNNSSELT